ncbi:MAG: DUF4145 domain-containing protein [bacterium]
MTIFKCPDCKFQTVVSKSEYDGTIQCSHCAQILRVSITGGITATVVPAVQAGPIVEGLPDPVKEVYDEARRCIGVKAFTAAELLCRKILMHVAVEKGASEGHPFAHYLAFLLTNGYIPSQAQQWVDVIRQHGNDSAHGLVPPNADRAQGTLELTAILLRMVYELEYKAKKFTQTP